MKNALDLLMDVVEDTECLSPEKHILFLNGQETETLSPYQIDIVQPFKPLASNEPVNYAENLYDVVLILGSKHVKETRFYIARALSVLKTNGILLIAADNKENGKRLDKWCQESGINAEIFSGHKAKCALASKTNTLNEAVWQAWEAEGKIQKNKGGFYSCPGLFSWDRIDAASRLLIDTIDMPLTGHGADFGCGSGYLGKSILEKHKGIKSLDGYDADLRALEACQQNLAEANIPINTFWEDLGLPQTLCKKYDFIVMNPPFHEGRQDTPALGLSFIQNAANALKRKGVLWMVANHHLPYEQTLSHCFFKVEKCTEENGFKVFRAEK